MTLVHIDHVSENVKVSLPLNMILPDDYARDGEPLERCKVLYLLHGLSDDASAWQRYTNIEVLAKEKNLVVVMPSAGRSFYADMDNGQKYFTYLTEELPAWLAATFRISQSREQTLIAGLSMGGYGAMKAAFLRPDLYSAACSLSGVLALNMLLAPAGKVKDMEFIRELQLLFGGLDKIPGSIHDPLTWMKNAVEAKLDLPELYAYSGQDDLLPLNRWFAKTAGEMGIKVNYTEHEGGHNWWFWNEHIKLWLDEVL
ncbi:MAG: alpha/beta hydrolase family protein [Anaerolineaceae bacterium]